MLTQTQEKGSCHLNQEPNGSGRPRAMVKGCSKGAEKCPMDSCSLQESCRWERMGTSLVCSGQGQPSPPTLEWAPPCLSFPTAMLRNVQQTLSSLPGESTYNKKTISNTTIHLCIRRFTMVVTPSWENPRGSGSVKGLPGAALPAGDGRAAPDAPSCAHQPLPGISTPLRALRQFYLSFKSIQIVLFPCESAHLVYVLQCQRGNL